MSPAYPKHPKQLNIFDLPIMRKEEFVVEIIDIFVDPSLIPLNIEDLG